MQEFFRAIPLRSKIIGGGIIMLPLATLFAFGAFFLQPDPLDQRVVWGCYVLDGAPPLLIEADAIRIFDGTGRSLSYIAEPYKEGYRLSVRPALQLQLVATKRYEFRQARGIGYFWPLLTAYSDDPRRLRSPENFGGRVSVAANGTSAVYVRSGDSQRCA
jgi:hypothetical protein